MADALRCLPSWLEPLSAFAFEPVGWWPLMPLAFAALCELLCAPRRLSRGRC